MRILTGRDAVVRLLLQSGADPTIKNARGDATNLANFGGMNGQSEFQFSSVLEG